MMRDPICWPRIPIVWYRGTNRVIAACKRHGAASPTFGERPGFLIVTFKAQMVAGGAVGTSAGRTAQVTADVPAQVAALCRERRSVKAIMVKPGLRHWKTFQANYLAPLMAMGVGERTIPDKPQSRVQKYRTTEAGLAAWKGSSK